MLPKTICSIITAFFLSTAVTSGAPVSPAQDMDTLESNIRSLKQEVLGLNRDLRLLDEDAFFPATTQVTLFLSLDVSDLFKLDSVEVMIDNRLIASHLYTEDELNALRRGGVQRLFMGNYHSGKHQLDAVFTGIGPDARAYRQTTTLAFEKTPQSGYVELEITDKKKKMLPEFEVRLW